MEENQPTQSQTIGNKIERNLDTESGKPEIYA